LNSNFVVKIDHIVNEKLIIEPHYLPTIRYVSYLYHATYFILDDESLFQKQSYRNRTYISGANAPLCLIVPVKKGKSKQAFKEVQIDNSTNWQHIHWTSFFSAYNNSPFFEHYRSIFEPYYFKKHTFLLDLNLMLLHELVKALNLETQLLLLSESEKSNDYIDFRNNIHPKEKYNLIDSRYIEQEYIQVFSDRFGFQTGLSVLDLLFSEGPNANHFLQSNFSF
jgi:hypothetical protein